MCFALLIFGRDHGNTTLTWLQSAAVVAVFYAFHHKHAESRAAGLLHFQECTVNLLPQVLGCSHCVGAWSCPFEDCSWSGYTYRDIFFLMGYFVTGLSA